MLRHALESFEHGLLHYLEGTELGRKFSILHIDLAVELTLKEKVARNGVSIFRKDGKIISVHEAYGALPSASIPERARLEDLHEFRNVVQHKDLVPDIHTTEFYIGEAYAFLKRFLREELGIAMESMLPRPCIRAIEMTQADQAQGREEVKMRLVDAEQLFSAGTYEMAVISAFVALEIAVRPIAKDQKLMAMATIMRRFVDSGQMPQSTWPKFREAEAVRNKAAHTGEGISKEAARSAINGLNELVEEMEKLKAPR
jgi:uncharacterized protein (UPF0332 family)